jgi:carboxyl-terminal processing protease
MYGDDIGIIRISQFAENTGENVKAAITSLTGQGATALVFDVRYNPGGALTGIVDTLDYLLPAGPIIRIVDKEGNEEAINSDDFCVTMPMAVLVNESTASAAELFTSALQDYQLATIIGTTTYGKGTMQTVVSLPDGSGITISYRMYNPPYSDNYEGIGVVPDIELPLTDELLEKNFYKITDEEDNQLQTAIAIVRGEMTVEEAKAGK